MLPAGSATGGDGAEGTVAPWRMLVFGATGAIGVSVLEAAYQRGWRVTGSSRKSPPPHRAAVAWAAYDSSQGGRLTEALAPGEVFDAVCWAQGANLSDSIYDVDEEAHLKLYDANCVFVLKSLRNLLAGSHLAVSGARLCVVSSIWQERVRQNKLSYAMTKAAIGGLVRSASLDLGKDGHLINAVLPGVLDTPMTHANLGSEQLERVQSSTLHGQLPTLSAVAETVCFLCSAANTGATGQSVAVDLGFSNARII